LGAESESFATTVQGVLDVEVEGAVAKVKGALGIYHRQPEVGRHAIEKPHFCTSQ